MPVYESICDKCKKYHCYTTTIIDCNNTPECCGQKTCKQIFTSPGGIVDIPAYISPVSGKLINSRKQRQYDLQSTGSRPYEGREAEQKEANRQRAYEEVKEDKAIDVAVEIAYAGLKPEQRKQLDAAV